MKQRHHSTPCGKETAIMSGRAFFGILLLAIGGGLLLDRAGVMDFGQIFATWWPMILILIAAIQLVTRSAPVIGSLIVLGVGLVFQAITLEFLPSNTWSYIWPLALVAIGLYLLLARGRGFRQTVSDADHVNAFVMFGGANARNESTSFLGGSVTAIFGGAEVDLRGAQLAAEGGQLDVTAAFGGVEITVPSGWPVHVTGLPIFGGWENKTQLSAEKSAVGPGLKVNCFAAFGGIEVHN
jgi:hypothetical protein